ncbi:hypothetical protein REPUB_Repub11eG0054800 [Reevesia pubescens]
MEATFLAMRPLFNIPKFLPQRPPGIQSTRRVTRACLSTAFERAEGSNAVAEAEGSSEISDAIREGSSEISDAHRDAIREGLYEAKHQTFATGEGRPPGSSTSFGADTAKDSIKKAVEVAENVGDISKKTLYEAWRAAKDTAQVDEVRKVDQLVDTQENRSIEEMKKLEDDHKAH